MATVTEEQIINKLQGYYESVDGMTSAYGFAENPDNITGAILPATLFYPQVVDMSLRAHHNQWQNDFSINAITFVAPRESSGGKLKFLENITISLIPSIRRKFQTASIIEDMLSLGLTRAFIQSIRYGAGGQLLTFNGIEYIGLVTTFQFTEIN